MSEVGNTDVRALGLESCGFYPCFVVGFHPVTNAKVRYAGDADRTLACKGPWVGPDGKTQLTRECNSVRLRVRLNVGGNQYEPGDFILWPTNQIEWLN